MTTPTHEICLATLVVLSFSLLFEGCKGHRPNNLSKTSQRHKKDQAMSSNNGKLTSHEFALEMRKLLCDFCPGVWKTYNERCADKSLKLFRGCGVVSDKYGKNHAEKLTRTGRCIHKHLEQLVSKCKQAMRNKHKDRPKKLDSHDDSYDESDLYTTLRNGIFHHEESDAPMGWRTIQGEWFQKLRANSAP
ncbi:uncharacterized protein LOC142768810 [Rhipicephalus microplus]|uniref:uncharacterized protein LOC142768810 n=1 Tax=Rhipicephalus microplus TaxID=6941 RepID=UPI003F6B23E3